MNKPDKLIGVTCEIIIYISVEGYISFDLLEPTGFTMLSFDGYNTVADARRAWKALARYRKWKVTKEICDIEG